MTTTIPSGVAAVVLRDPDPALDVAALPRQLSPSRAGDFHQCPQKFFYGTILKQPSEPTLETTVGTVSHYAFEHAFDLPAEERSLLAVQGFVGLGWAELTLPTDSPAEIAGVALPPADGADLDAAERAAQNRLNNAVAYRVLAPAGSANEKHILATAREMVAKWFLTEAVHRVTPVATEQHLYLELGADHHGVKTHGIIDRVDSHQVGDERRMYITDYKTGSQPDDRYISKTFNAMRVYASLAEAEYGIRPYALRLVFTNAGSSDGIRSEIFTSATIEQGKTWMSSAWKGMRDAAESGVWRAKVTKLCDWCPFQAACPAQGPALAAAAEIMRTERAARKVAAKAAAAAALTTA